MKTRSKRITLIGLTAVALGLTIGTLSAVNFGGYALRNIKADTFDLTLNASNGAATLETRKTSFETAKTGLGNDLKVEYKNMTPVEGKIGKLNAARNGFKAYYGNSDPINGFNKIVINSNATAGQATVKYGLTSSCVGGSFDLADGQKEGITANYFRIEANEEVTIESVSFLFDCDNTRNGAEFKNSSNQDVVGGYKFSKKDSEYYMSRDSSYSSVTRIVVPDYYGTGEDYLPVATMGDGSSTGCFEGNPNLAELYIPETVTSFARYNFYTANKITEFTLPRDLANASGYTVPRGELQTLNIHSKRLTDTSTSISDSNQSKLSRINVFADVEALPKLINSWPSGVSIYYEGTEADWASLVEVSDTKWADTANIDVICFDTTVCTINLHFDNATLNGESNAYQTSVITGKTFADPGKPAYTDNAKKFVGWYLDSEFVNAATFPLTITENVDLYAKFIDWPAGTSIENPVTLTAGVAQAIETDEDSTWFYMTYTATQDEVVRFAVDEDSVTKAGGTASADPVLKVYNASKAEVTLSGNMSPSTDIKKVACYNGDPAVKIRFTAGETFYIAFILGYNSYSGTVAYGTANLNVTSLNDTNQDYLLSTPYTIGEEIDTTVGDGYFKWYTFTLNTAKTLLLAANGSKCTVWSSIEIGKFADGAYVTVASMNNSSSSNTSKIVELTAGAYYVSIRGYNGNVAYRLSEDLPELASKETAGTITVDGEAVATVNNGFNPNWFKFTADAAGSYLLTGSIDLYTTSGYYTVTKTYIAAIEKEDGTALTLGDNFTELNAKKFYAELEAGTYYVKLTYTNSNAGYTLAVSKMLDATLSFNSNGGSEVAPINTKTGIAITAPANPSKEGYRFDGWFVDEELTQVFDFTAGIDEDTTVYAKWVLQRYVTLHTNDGQENQVVGTDDGAAFAAPTPTRTGYGFGGWFYDEALTQAFDPTAIVNADFDLYASWFEQHYENSACSYLEGVAGATDYLYGYNEDPVGLESTGSYPFALATVDGYGTVIKSTNKGINNSNSTLTMNFKNACKLTFTYYAQSENATKWDYFHVSINGTDQFTDGGSAGSTQTKTLDIAAGDVVKFIYVKDGSSQSGMDGVYIYNFIFAAAE